MSELLHFKMDFVKIVLFLFGITWITNGAPVGNSVDDTFVPEIEECFYRNAFSVTCRWKKPVGGGTAEYRLGYLSAADSAEDRRERFCQMTEEKREGDVIFESCGIRGSMYGRFTLFVASVRNCDEETHCDAIAKSKTMDFTCTSSNVKLTVPPSALEIETDIQRLSWYPPERENSMLSFVFHRRKVLYRVEFREILEQTKISEWQEWYTGYKTSIFLPMLVPGATYEVRVYASMDSVTSRFGMTSPTSMENREWTEPSNILVFLVPQVMKKSGPETTFKAGKKPTASEPTTVGALGDIILPVPVSQKTIVVTAVTSFVVIVILAVAGYFLPWKRWCCCIQDVKFAEPKIAIDLEDSFNGQPKPSTKPNMQELPPKVGERFQPITQLLGFSQDFQKQTRVYNSDHSRYFGLQRAEAADIEYGRKRMLPPTPMRQMQDNFSLNDLLDHDISLDDVTRRPDLSDSPQIYKSQRPWEISQSKKELRTTGKDREDTDDDTPPRYVKLCQDSNENLEAEDSLPSYIVTSECGHVDRESSSLDRSCDYVDETGIDLGFITGGDTSYGYDKEEKHKQWKKFILEGSQSGFSDSRSDDVPDYVMHAPSLSKEFSQNMSMFVSMATEDVTQRVQLDFNDVTKNLLFQQDAVYDEELRHNDKGSSQFIFMTMCPSCKSSEKHECCDRKDFSSATETCLPIPVIGNRRSSVSGHSVDSGYSPDSPDFVIGAVIGAPEALGPRFGIRDNSIKDDTDSDEYMTYVTT